MCGGRPSTGTPSTSPPCFSGVSSMNPRSSHTGAARLIAATSFTGSGLPAP